MNTFVRFLFDFLSIFFGGIKTIIMGILGGLIQMFNFSEYAYVIDFYRKDFSGIEWVLVVIVIIVLIVLLFLVGLLIYFFIRKYVVFRKRLIEQESMLEEIGNLHKQVCTLVQEKERILEMKVSKLGFKDNLTTENTNTSVESSSDEETLSDSEDVVPFDLTGHRFTKLSIVDYEFRNYKIQTYNNSFTLEELVNRFRMFSASKLGLYYTEDMIRLFISSLAATRLVILQGISGTGKTSLAYAWGKFIRRDAIIAAVQPSWRDRTELFGYFNEFTKKFNETEFLKGIYTALYTDDVYLTVLDEMNIARVEYYFAEMLSILEMPSRDEWKIELVSSQWDTDPKLIVEGKIQIPANMWYIGTINNDDSTFAVTDKVYDRAMSIDINDKCEVFEAADMDSMNINSSYLESLFDKAKEDFPISDDMNDKIAEMDAYVIKHFRIAFGNRIVKQMKDFVSAYVACGGREIDGVDYYIARKILRKFEQLNLSYIRDEVEGFITYLDNQFGKDNFTECKEYLNRLKKLV